MIPTKRVTRSASAAAAAAKAIPTDESASKKLKTETKKPVSSRAAKAKISPTEDKKETKPRKPRATKSENKPEEPAKKSPSPESTATAPEAKPAKARASRSKSEVKETEEKPESDAGQGLSEGSYLPEDLAPVVTDSGEEVKLQELAKSNGFIIFFYPRANTPGCTIQACGFRDRLPDATSNGYKIYGMSADSPKAQTSWKNKHNLGYTLLCDPEYKVLKRLGVTKQPKGIKRSHIVVEKGGKIKSLKIQIGPKPSVEHALDTVTQGSE